MIRAADSIYLFDQPGMVGHSDELFEWSHIGSLPRAATESTHSLLGMLWGGDQILYVISRDDQPAVGGIHHLRLDWFTMIVGTEIVK